MSNISSLSKNLTSIVPPTIIAGCKLYLKSEERSESSAINTLNLVLNLFVKTIACPTTVLLNVLVIAAVKRRPRLQTNSNTLLACLAGVDALTGLVIYPLLVASNVIDLRNVGYRSHCVLFQLMVGAFHVVCLSSIFHLALVTFERVVAIKYTLHYFRIVTKESIRSAVVAIWIATAFMGLLGSAVTSYLPKASVYFSGVIVLAMAFMVFFIVLCHAVLLQETSRHRKTIMSEQIPQEEARKFITENKALKTTAYVVGALLLCYVPLVLFMLVVIRLKVLLNAIPVIRPWMPTLVALNSLLNPFIYCWRQKEMRKFIFRNPFSLHAVGPG